MMSMISIVSGNDIACRPEGIAARQSAYHRRIRGIVFFLGMAKKKMSIIFAGGDEGLRRVLRAELKICAWPAPWLAALEMAIVAWHIKQPHDLIDSLARLSAAWPPAVWLNFLLSERMLVRIALCCRSNNINRPRPRTHLSAKPWLRAFSLARERKEICGVKHHGRAAGGEIVAPLAAYRWLFAQTLWRIGVK